MPESYPQVSKDELKSFQSLRYADLAYEIISKFVGDSIPDSDLKSLIQSVYTVEKFGSDQVVPVENIYDDIFVEDLSTGPSLAFKDLALQFLGSVMDYELNRRGEKLTILGASSGDTVSAAEEALKSKERIKVFMLTPRFGMSPFQKLQAGSILDDNIYNIAIDAPFDRCQDIVKQVNMDAEFKQKYSIGAVNSINWGRICAQIVYYFAAFLQTSSDLETPITAVVPSGNFGNILAAFIAKMGCPIKTCVIATNENKVLDTFFKTGVYEQTNVAVTNAPSMDISKASNLERFLYELLDRDPKALKDAMDTFESTGKVDLSDHLPKMKQHFLSGESNRSERLETIKEVYERSGRVVDPHTASGIFVAQELSLEGPVVFVWKPQSPVSLNQR